MGAHLHPNSPQVPPSPGIRACTTVLLVNLQLANVRLNVGKIVEVELFYYELLKLS